MVSRSTLGKINGRYELREQLGAGGMGIVYRAIDRLTGQSVALKRVVTGAENLDFNSRSRDSDLDLALAPEFRALASMRYPYIISVLDYGFDAEQQPYFTMELLEDAQDLLRAATP